ncbi:MAG: hypothetical protein J07HQW2_00185 [Haloquadratum walsbyi J07HQW2]|uniref:Uncharacterized protein n=1 Tax=Haloquadratum walsbyi J07HQW2 TaxID=1238425 RepID=U1PNC6_9EURY|nr:MAG: hypothetical protein J07HQW2_00185 [Haloquadratum walsbyi J07HQW2]
MEINNRRETRPNVALNSAFTTGLMPAVLIIASISLLTSVGTVTAQQIDILLRL